MPSTPSYCPVSSDPMPATARPAGSTTQPLSRAADQIVAMPQLGPQTRGTVSAPWAAPSSPQEATGQSGNRSSRRPDGAAARRSRQNSDTIVTIVQPTCSGPADARFTRVSAAARSPAAVRTAAGTPADRHGEARSEAIARSRSRTVFASGHRRAATGAGPDRSAVGMDLRSAAAVFAAADASYTECLSEWEHNGMPLGMPKSHALP